MSSKFPGFKKIYWYYWERMREVFFKHWLILATYVLVINCSPSLPFFKENKIFENNRIVSLPIFINEKRKELGIDKIGKIGKEKMRISKFISFNIQLSSKSYFGFLSSEDFFDKFYFHWDWLWEKEDVSISSSGGGGGEKMRIASYFEKLVRENIILVMILPLFPYLFIFSFLLLALMAISVPLSGTMVAPKGALSNQVMSTGEDELVLISASPISRFEMFWGRLLAYFTRFLLTHLAFEILPLILLIMNFFSSPFLISLVNLVVFLILNVLVIPLLGCCLISPIFYFPITSGINWLAFSSMLFFKIGERFGIVAFSIPTLIWGSFWTYLAYRKFRKKDYN